MSSGIIFGVLFVLSLYLLPAIIAIARKHQNTGAVVTLNVLAGWTMIGWVAAFVWSMTNRP